ncbi:MAG: hypothetical protein QNJ73_11120 [Gammaproteobacteria bacterium]|nr:hypothetical protein [Gammaproteobacteria bacterium]
MRKLTGLFLLLFHLPVATAQTGAPTTPESMYTMPDPVTLSESDIQGVLGAVPELEQLGLDSELDNEATSPEQLSAALAANSQAMNIIDNYGFTPDSFTQVMYSIGMAMAALEMQASGMDPATAQSQQQQMLEQMQSQMTPEQYQAMMAQLGMANQAMQQVADQPAGNVALVQQYLPQLNAIFD